MLMDEHEPESPETDLTDLIFDVSDDLRQLWGEEDIEVTRFADLILYISISFAGMLNCTEDGDIEEKLGLIAYVCENIVRKTPNGDKNFKNTFNLTGPQIIQDFYEKANKGPLKAPGYAAAIVGQKLIGKERLTDVFIETADTFLEAYKKLLGPLKVTAR